MRLNCPIQYEIFGTTWTNKRPARRYYEEVVAVDIEEIALEDAPVAVEWMPAANPATYAHARDRGISGPDGLQLTRWHDNAHWQRLCDGHFFGSLKKGSPLTTVNDLEKMLASPHQNSAAIAATRLPPMIDDLLRPKIVRVEDDPRRNFDIIRTDGRETRIRQLEQRAKALIVVDGVLHRRCIEPFISVSLQFENDNLCYRDMGIEATYQALWGPTSTTFAFFCLSEWDKAVEFAIDRGFVPTEELPSGPRILLEQSLSPDWNLAWRAAAEIKSLGKHIEMFSRVRDPLLTEAMTCLDPERQHELLLAFNPFDPRWAYDRVARQSYEKVMSILEDRSVNLPMSSSLPKP